jgi:hypothetical protein
MPLRHTLPHAGDATCHMPHAIIATCHMLADALASDVP